MRKTRTYPRFNENAPESMRTDSGTLLCSSIRGTGPTWPHVEEQVVVPPWEDPRHDILNDSEHRRPARPNWATTSRSRPTNNSLSIYDTHVWWRCGPYRARNCCVATPSVAAFDPSGPIRERAMEVRACVVAASQHHAFRGRRGGADPCDVLLTLLRPPGEIGRHRCPQHPLICRLMRNRCTAAFAPTTRWRAGGTPGMRVKSRDVVYDVVV